VVSLSSHRLWEWTVDCGTESPSTGVSGARHRAMEALSRSPLKNRDRASGHVVPVTLVDNAFGCFYRRLSDLEIKADCERGIIRWH
jgi:hypothetical protein